MNDTKTRVALKQLAQAARELAHACDREAPEYGPTWNRVASNAEALTVELSRSDAESLLRSIGSLFSYHPGSFTEVYVQRPDVDEQVAENVKFDQLRRRVEMAVGELSTALKEGEVNTLAVRRHLTELETAFLDEKYQQEAESVRGLLNAEKLDYAAVMRLCIEWATKRWRGAVGHQMPAAIDAITVELAPYIGERAEP